MRIFGAQQAELVVYGHIHRPYVRTLVGLTVANSGSVGLPYDGDWRASYLLIEDGTVSVRRVEYDLERELSDIRSSGFPSPSGSPRASVEACSPGHPRREGKCFPTLRIIHNKSFSRVRASTYLGYSAIRYRGL